MTTLVETINGLLRSEANISRGAGRAMHGGNGGQKAANTRRYNKLVKDISVEDLKAAFNAAVAEGDYGDMHRQRDIDAAVRQVRFRLFH